MKTITTHEAKTHLSRYLAATEQGEKFIIARGKIPIALLSPIPNEGPQTRPKVGETLGPRMSVPDSALAPLTAEEIEEWLK